MLEECRHLKAGAEGHLRIALLNVDYVTSFELAFWLLLTCTAQLLTGLRDALQISQKNVFFNGKRFGASGACCYQRYKPSLIGYDDRHFRNSSF